jgi:CheY-like chemotaxis protein
METPLQGLSILVLDDELLAAMDLAYMLRALGASVVGPVGTLEEAEQLAKDTPLNGAVLDVKIENTNSLGLAGELNQTGIPVILATGYGSKMLPEPFTQTPHLAKPYSAASVRTVTTRHFRGPA